MKKGMSLLLLLVLLLTLCGSGWKEEPTILVFFGDHRPNLFMTDGDTVYTKLGLCPDNDTVNWTEEQINDLYSTDYV